MPSPEIQSLMTVLVLAGGAGIFLRLVGNEKHRREQWLRFRLEEKMKKLQQANEAESENVEAISVDNV